MQKQTNLRIIRQHFISISSRCRRSTKFLEKLIAFSSGTIISDRENLELNNREIKKKRFDENRIALLSFEVSRINFYRFHETAGLLFSERDRLQAQERVSMHMINKYTKKIGS